MKNFPMGEIKSFFSLNSKVFPWSQKFLLIVVRNLSMARICGQALKIIQACFYKKTTMVFIIKKYPSHACPLVGICWRALDFSHHLQNVRLQIDSENGTDANPSFRLSMTPKVRFLCIFFIHFILRARGIKKVKLPQFQVTKTRQRKSSKESNPESIHILQDQVRFLSAF